MKIKVGQKEIGEGCPPYIVAEIGSNFITKADCLNSIVQAKLAGASAAKFQLYTHQELYGMPGEARGVLDPEWLPHLKQKADSMGIDLMCTAFSPEGYDIVNPYVDIHKVASAEMTHVRILEKLRTLGKPVIMSTGASGKRDIEMAIQALGDTPKVLMYCVAAYPANEVNLNVISLFRDTFNTLVGYSDHSTDVAVIPSEAVKRGASVIEKHFTAIPDVETPDRGHALNPAQFRRLVEYVYGRVSAHIGPAQEEKPMILRHNRRLIAIKDIRAGDVCSEGENFGIYRSLKDDTHAFSPFAIDNVNLKTSLTDIKAGNGIGPGDV